MPLPVLVNLVAKYYPKQYFVHIGIVLIIIFVIRAYAQGRTTNRDRDLHGRVILLTGGFTPFGSRLLEELARRGAHIITLTHLPVESPEVTLIVEAVRETTKNEQIFVEQCDILSLPFTREFCTKFLTGKETRLDAIVFAHEYGHVGPLFLSKEERLACEERRSAASDSTFLMITLLLPTLLVAPAERDIRIINVVNPFYAAAVPKFPTAPPIEGSQLLRESFRALRGVVLMRHLQRVLDALPQAPSPNPDTAADAAASNKRQKSNIVAVSVSPGFSRQDTVAPLLRAQLATSESSILGFLTYFLLQPLLRIFAKAPSHAVQSVLHALFLPTPFKFASIPAKENQDSADNHPSEEALKPGALYADCSIVGIDLRNRDQIPDDEKEAASKAKIVDDGEYGGEALGRFVWESFEESLKAREAGTSNAASTSSADKKTT
ncbi:uncharacterized protein FOMMEDRAFT_75011 [Fomitiporia mediterranea MF3/22]|uniref:uncharacterized protein n=1 Tax=Fomitiporia mediterranea (strain MF3/22) TaxID=694068 RepID=UPI00044075C6|nr:uncharacterized protein FOMMEDRAFT_75011 [Fomitiporia mediterranea MF3/22]EJD08240.1 hypothetical protein FOMMEDRAFT_75011 [Fomitiporia mediterranea MF3/22]